MTEQQKKKRAEAQRVWYHKNKHTDEYKNGKLKRVKAYLQKHPFNRLARAIRKRAAEVGQSCEITSSDIFKIAHRQRLICALTGRKLTNENISPDHIKPLIDGGNSSPDNLQLVIREANIAKNRLSNDEFVKLCRDVALYNDKVT